MAGATSISGLATAGGAAVGSGPGTVPTSRQPPSACTSSSSSSARASGEAVAAPSSRCRACSARAGATVAPPLRRAR